MVLMVQVYPSIQTTLARYKFVLVMTLHVLLLAIAQTIQLHLMVTMLKRMIS